MESTIDLQTELETVERQREDALRQLEEMKLHGNHSTKGEASHHSLSKVPDQSTETQM